MAWEKLLTEYGPLALGWVAFGVIWVRHSRFVDRAMTAFEKSNTVLAELKVLLKERLPRGGR